MVGMRVSAACLLPVLCTGTWGQEQGKNSRGILIPYSPLVGGPSSLALPLSSFKASRSCAGEEAGMQVGWEGFREGQASLAVQ